MIPRWIGFFRAPGQRRKDSSFDDELHRSGHADLLWAAIQEWEARGFLLPSWRHPEPGTSFEAMGPPRSTLRVYCAEHAGQIVLLHVTTHKRGRGKLEAQTKSTVERRLADWKQWFPHGAELDDEGRLRPRGGTP